jgi:hypothetical protein
MAEDEVFRRPSEPHLIWSGSHNAWYRPGACGYTCDIAQAGVFRRPPGAVNTDEKRERQVYLDEAIADIEARRAALMRDLANLGEIETKLRLFQK